MNHSIEIDSMICESDRQGTRIRSGSSSSISLSDTPTHISDDTYEDNVNSFTRSFPVNCVDENGMVTIPQNQTNLLDSPRIKILSASLLNHRHLNPLLYTRLLRRGTVDHLIRVMREGNGINAAAALLLWNLVRTNQYVIWHLGRFEDDLRTSGSVLESAASSWFTRLIDCIVQQAGFVPRGSILEKLCATKGLLATPRGLGAPRKDGFRSKMMSDSIAGMTPTLLQS